MDKIVASYCYTAVFLSISGVIMLASGVTPYAYWLLGVALVTGTICVLKRRRKVR